MLKLKLQYFSHLMRRADSFKKTLMLGGIGGRRPLSQSLPSGSFHKPLIVSIRGQAARKPESQETSQTDHTDHSLV